MAAQDFGVTIVGASAALQPIPGVDFLTVYDEAEPVAFSAVCSAFNHSAALRGLLDLAREMSRWTPNLFCASLRTYVPVATRPIYPIYE
ncbi:hypothetical protein [Nitrobacter winogradskyi]|uniref:Uncharacterized protein n=2 Tax=Nitrobacter winogradskyi TaxID=913 RepID=A0ACC6APT1_NITWI|nr:hypothetical protein [Nitrobacter winogradskyi]MCP2001281.1 hypothetical protein [Nitrobacter winogradskyi]GEC16810.1 hypothetical protein NWI01_27020 [Nitrobacter winogradskyi]